MPAVRSVCSWSCLALLLGLGLVVGGCGYTTKATYPREVQSVAVPVFANHTFYRQIEFELTRAVIQEIQLRTPYKVVGNDRAQSVIEGVIVRVEPSQSLRGPSGGLPEVVDVRISVDYQWTDLRSGEVLRERRGLSTSGQYIPAQPVGELPVTASRGAVRDLAQRIVGQMRDDWSSASGRSEP